MTRPTTLATIVLLLGCAHPGDDGPGDDVAPACGADAAARFEAVDATFAARLDALGIAGGAIAVVCGSETIFARGHGVTRRTGGGPVTERTRFQLASNTKLLTAITAVKLAAAGTIDLDAPVSTVLPGINDRAPFGTSFSLAHLLSHTAGIGSPEDAAELDADAYFAAHGDLPLWAPPGALWQYSNIGFGLVGHALAHAAGQPIADLVADAVFAPLALADSAMHPDVDATRSTYGYSTWFGPGEEEVPPDDEYLASTLYAPMGGAWMSAGDVAVLARALLGGGGDLIDADGLARITTAHTPTDTAGMGYGYGLFVSTDGMWWHSGLTSGWSSDLTMIPADGFAVVTLVNTDADFPFEAVDAAVAAFSTPRSPPPPPDPPATADLVGTYHSADLGDLVVDQRGDALGVTVGGHRVALTWSYERTFAFQYAPWGAEIEATFWADDSGVFRYLATPAGVGIRP